MTPQSRDPGPASRPAAPSPSIRIDEPEITPRQLQVMELIADGLTSKQIADRLRISENTVDMHRKNIYRSLRVHSSIAMIRRGIRLGLLRGYRDLV